MNLLRHISAWWASRPEAAPAAARTAAAPAPAPAAPQAPPFIVAAVGDALRPGGTTRPAAGMVVDGHRLLGAPFEASPFLGRAITPRFIVMHYTAGGSARNSIAAIRDRGLSAHFFVERDGEVIQTVPCNRLAHHAGASSWRGYDDLNSHSIGIEVCNLGWLDCQEGAGWTRDGLGRVVPAAQVVVARHKGGGKVMGWEAYPEAQLLALEHLARAILAAYPTITEIVGHDDIAPARKVDPGPAFPLPRFQALRQARPS